MDSKAMDTKSDNDNEGNDWHGAEQPKDGPTTTTNAIQAKTDATSRAKPRSPPYSVYVAWERWAIVIIVSLGALFSPLTANIYFPAIPTIANAFHVSVEKINLTVTVYMIVQGISPSVWGSVADRKGRRPAFLLCLVILLLSCIGLALVPTSDYWLLVLLRCIQAAGSASTVAFSAGVVADIVPAEERGGYIGISGLGPMIGPCLGPVIGGLLSDRLGWRSIFWFLTISSGVCFVGVLLFLPETLRSIVGNGSIPAQRWNRALIPVIGRNSLEINTERPPNKPLPNPFKLFTHPDLVILLVSTAVIYSAFYAVTATLSSLFEDNYPFLSESLVGVTFLGIGAGGVVATVTAGKLLDWQYQYVKRQFRRKMQETREAAPNQRDNDPEKRDDGQSHDSDETLSNHDDFPIERACLLSQHVWIWIFSIACIGYGWVIQAKTNIAVPLVLHFILGYTMVAAMTNTQTLIVDLFPTQGSSVTAANNLIRCLMGAATVSVINIITNALQPGWTYTLCGCICVLTWPMIILLLKMGPRWRKRRMQKARDS